MTTRLRRTPAVAVASLVVLAGILAGAWFLFFAEEGPPDADIITIAVSHQLPVYWSVRSARISVSVKDEADGGPAVYRQRIESVVTPREELYVIAQGAESIGPFSLVNRRFGPGEEYTLHGSATSTRSSGRWSTAVVLENSVEELGQPRSAFDGPVLVAGSENAARAIAELDKARALVGRAAAAMAADYRSRSRKP